MLLIVENLRPEDTIARFVLETGDPSEHSLDELEQRKDTSSDNWSVYKRGQADGSSVKRNYLRSSSVQTKTNLLA